MLFLNTKRIFGVFLVVLFLFVFYNIEKKKFKYFKKRGNNFKFIINSIENNFIKKFFDM